MIFWDDENDFLLHGEPVNLWINFSQEPFLFSSCSYCIILEQLKSILGDKLPTYYANIFAECQKPGNSKMSTTVSTYADALIKVWLKSFGGEPVLTRRAVEMKSWKAGWPLRQQCLRRSTQDKAPEKGNVVWNEIWETYFVFKECNKSGQVGFLTLVRHKLTYR